MNRVHKTQITFAVLFKALALIVMFTSSSNAAAQGNQTPGPHVTIVSPLPLPVTGEMTVQPGGSINIANPATSPVPVQFGIAKRYQATQFAGSSIAGVTLVPLVETGATFIVTFLNVIGFSNNSTVPLTDGECFLRLSIVNSSGPTIGSIPTRINMGTVVGSESAFLPINEGEGLTVQCAATPSNAEFRINVSGYFVPAVH